MNKKDPIYLDYNATAPPMPQVKKAMIHVMDEMGGNPSSVHSAGRAARRVVEQARESIGVRLGCDPINITFTSGATEANNWVFAGAAADMVFVSAIEHPCVLEATQHFQKSRRFIPVDADGVVDVTWLDKALAETMGRTLVSIMAVNNETGVIQPVEKIAALCKKHDAFFHCDAVQAIGKIPFNINESGADFVSLSAHKIGGPAGIGALVFNHHLTLEKFIYGGGQERRRRAGTENLIGIAGFAKAIELVAPPPSGGGLKEGVFDVSHDDGAPSPFPSLKGGELWEQWSRWRNAAESAMQQAVPSSVVAGKDALRTSNVINISLPGVPAQTQLMNMDMAGFAVSTGSACSSGSVKPSHVLQAMGWDDAQVTGALRISMGWQTCEEDIKKFTAAWIDMAGRLFK